MDVNHTICWYCKNAVGNCSWSDKSFTPVEGWTAEKTVINGNGTSYIVRDCPLFVVDDDISDQKITFVTKDRKGNGSRNAVAIAAIDRDGKYHTFESLKKTAEFLSKYNYTDNKIRTIKDKVADMFRRNGKKINFNGCILVDLNSFYKERNKE